MTATATTDRAERSRWRSVAIPNEHGGWGLTAEPVLLGLLLAPSIAGALLGLAAVLAFLVRTPLKLISIDLRHRRWLERSRLALGIAGVEVVVIALAAAVALSLAGPTWLVPVAVAAPLAAVEWWYDSRGRGRRLVPELVGAVGISAVAAAIVIAGDGSDRRAIGAWLVLAARAVGAIPFVRVQIARLRRGQGSARTSDAWQVAAVLIAATAAVVDAAVVLGALGVGVLAMLQTRWVRRPPVPPKRLGVTQMVLGIALVAVTAAGALIG